ncbi:glycosyltransferase family 2 protein [Pseudoflavonifractor sp. 524-17]|uniref:glycosyltransferase family 2 protein n=1 Tax=Pseudoflavonifractor sp. 524-17 TaxID=2304577 RepID=UPI00137A3576|nr:glycosyltransferase family A protein [Pseudoflavonifractor sp. 524-17]NCE66177.1 glycosyltransferase family 2 protein [Pseudoflavonifractor sp. 524-17]
MGQEGTPNRDGVVSIVTPVYNGERHLAAMLDSVLAQTYPQIDMILTDDGSDDGTLQVAEAYRGRFAGRGYGFRVVTGPHKNASAAINRGLPYVTGEFLIWPDSDDILKPESVERRVSFLRKNPEYQCVRSLAWYFDGETGAPREEADEKQGDLSREALFWDVLEFRTFVCCGCYMFRSAAFFDIYPRRCIPEYDVGQNFQMLLPFLYRHRCPTLREALYGVCVRRGSHSRTELTQAQEEKKYADYERLVDEIAALCAMDSREALNRVARWKAERRYHISLKYGRWGAAFQALVQLRRCGGFQIGGALKELLWAVCRDSWMWKKLYPAYSRFFHNR